MQNSLKTLDYQQNWLDFGILTPELLALQIENFHQGDDKNTEHFRYGCFLEFIRRHEHFSDLQIKNFITLVEQDSDSYMTGSALKALFLCGKLTDHQHQTVAESLLKFGDWAKKVVERMR